MKVALISHQAVTSFMISCPAFWPFYNICTSDLQSVGRVRDAIRIAPSTGVWSEPSRKVGQGDTSHAVKTSLSVLVRSCRALAGRGLVVGQNCPPQFVSCNPSGVSKGGVIEHEPSAALR